MTICGFTFYIVGVDFAKQYKCFGKELTSISDNRYIMHELQH